MSDRYRRVVYLVTMLTRCKDCKRCTTHDGYVVKYFCHHENHPDHKRDEHPGRGTPVQVDGNEIDRRCPLGPNVEAR